VTLAARVVGAEVLRQVKRIELRARRLVNTLFSGEYRSVFRGQGIEFAEVRAYQTGDEYRSIDWNVSARMGSPYVKTYEEERELTLMLVVSSIDPVPLSSVAQEPKPSGQWKLRRY